MMNLTEIIKALRCRKDVNADCDKCQYHVLFENRHYCITEQFGSEAADAIEKLQAENEQLRRDKNRISSEIIIQQDTIEMLQSDISQLDAEIDSWNNTECTTCPISNIEACDKICFSKVDLIEHIAKCYAENAELKAKLAKAVVMPCKVGDTIYVVGLKCLVENIPRWECAMFECDDCNRKADYEIFKKTATVNFIQRLMSEKDDLFVIGKTVFLTREEAEAALKGATE